MIHKQLLAFVGLAFALTACPGPASGVSSVFVTAPAANALKINAPVAFSAVAKDSSGAEITGKTFTWVSSDPNVASVDASGMVTAKRFGDVKITASTDSINGESPSQKTFGLEAIGGTYNRPFVAATSNPSTAFLFRFRKENGGAPTTTVNFTMTGPSGWNAGAPLAINGFASFAPFIVWSFFDPVAVSGAYQLSTTIDGVLYSSSFNVDATDILPAVTNVTSSAATATGVTGNWTAASGVSIYRMAIIDITAAVELAPRSYTTNTTAAITGTTMNTAGKYLLAVTSFPFDPRNNNPTLISGTLPTKFNISRNRVDITF
jgi:hypothetical protein